MPSGFMGARGRGTPELCGVAERVDILTGTLGKALGGASGGYTAARREIIELAAAAFAALSVFQQHAAGRCRGVSLRVLDLHRRRPRAARRTLMANARRFRSGLSAAGFDLVPGEHPIIPVMLGDAALASRMAERLLQQGVYVIGFSFPVVPRGRRASARR